MRWRLALISSALTFLMLCAFAVVIGQLTASRIRSDFRNEMIAAVDKLRDQPDGAAVQRIRHRRDHQHRRMAIVDNFAASNNAVIRDPRRQRAR